MGVLCHICHVRKIKHLCPAKGKVQTAGSGYHSFTKNVKRFLEMSSWPVNIDPDQLDDGEGCTKEPFSIIAKTCAIKPKRACKRTHREIYECVSQCKTQSATSMAPLKTCFFCNKLQGNVFTASTIQSDTRERGMATWHQNPGSFTE